MMEISNLALGHRAIVLQLVVNDLLLDDLDATCRGLDEVVHVGGVRGGLLLILRENDGPPGLAFQEMLEGGVVAELLLFASLLLVLLPLLGLGLDSLHDLLLLALALAPLLAAGLLNVCDTSIELVLGLRVLGPLLPLLLLVALLIQVVSIPLPRLGRESGGDLFNLHGLGRRRWLRHD